MTKLRIVVAAFAAMMVAVPAWADGELHLYNWGDYTSPELIKKFEEAFKVKVTLDEYDSNETMLAKVRGGGTGYDIVVPSDYAVAIMVEEGLLAQTEPNAMENYGHLAARWRDVYWDSGRHYSVPWQWGTTSFSVNTAKFKGDIGSLNVLYEPPQELCGRINMLTDMNEVINMGLRYLNLPRCNNNPDDLTKLNELLTKAKTCWRSFSFDSLEKLISGDVDVSQNWNGYSFRAREQNPAVVYAYPKEGVTGWADNVTVLKDAPNLENAKLFQNFILAPENAALISNYAHYANGIDGSDKFMDQTLLDAPEVVPPAGSPEPEFVPPCGQEVNDKYNQIWTNLLK